MEQRCVGRSVLCRQGHYPRPARKNQGDLHGDLDDTLALIRDPTTERTPVSPKSREFPARPSRAPRRIQDPANSPRPHVSNPAGLLAVVICPMGARIRVATL